MASPRVYQVRPSVRMKSDEHQRLAALAEAAGLSLSRYLVEAGLRETPPTAAERRPSNEDRIERDWLKAQLVRVGNNVNQAVRRLHMQTGTTTYARLDQVLDELADILARIKADLGRSKE